MINLKMKNSIISLYLHYGSIRNVAKILNISRNTVKKYLNENKELVEKLKETSDNSQIALLQNELLSPPKRKKSVRIKYAYTKDVEKRFNELLTIDETRNKELGKNKQNLTAAKIHRVLLDEGFNVSLTTISNKWREAKSKVKECFIIQDYEYGYRAEFDFHQIILIINGEKKTLHQATITLPKSNYIFGMLFEDEKIHSVLSSLIQFFHTCGIPKTVVFDNMSTVVKRFKSKNGKEYTDDIIKLSNYYHFKIITTNTYSGNEKGSVEVSGKLMRREFFSINYKFDLLDEAIIYYQNELDKFNLNILNEYEIEKKHLIQPILPQYEIGEFRKAKVNNYSLISCESNFYSVPDKMVGLFVNCYVSVNRIIIYNDSNEYLCSHNKKDGIRKYSIDIHHYIDTFKKKPKAIQHSLALQHAPEILKTIFNKYFTTDPELFLHILINSDQFLDDNSLEETACELGMFTKKYKSKYCFYANKPTFEAKSIAQIKEITEMFQGVKNNV